MSSAGLSDEMRALRERFSLIRDDATAANGVLLSSMQAACVRALNGEVEMIRHGQMSSRFAGLLKEMMGTDVERLLKMKKGKERIEKELQVAESFRDAILMSSPKQLYLALAMLQK